MRTRTACLPVILLLAACASSGLGEDRVPVYTSIDDVPCEFELVRILQVASSERFGDLNEFRTAQGRVLGREGRKLGADAVVAPQLDSVFVAAGELTGTMVSVPLGTPPPSVIPPEGGEPEFIFEGNAIRFIEGTCR